MSQLALTGLALVTAALLALAVAGATWLRRIAAPGSLVLCGAGALLAIAALIEGAAPATLALPLGPPGVAMRLGFDGLSGFFLLLLLVCGGLVAVAGFDEPDAASARFLPLLLGAMALTVLAADGFALVTGIVLTAMAASLPFLGTGAQVLRGAGALIGGVVPKVAIYVLIRVLFGFSAPEQSPWWGAALMLLGAAAAVWGALRANLEGDLRSVLAFSIAGNTGLAAVGLGVALAARAIDLPALAALGLGAALLLALAHALTQSSLLLGAAAVEAGAGSRRLDRLGGLIHRMPVTTACVLASAAALAAVPATSGFAGQWTLFQAVFGASHGSGPAFSLAILAVVVLMALATALMAAAAIRLVGIGFLGRPRSPRGAAAVEAGAGTRVAMLGLSVATVLAGLFPGAVLALAAPALGALTGASMAGRAGALTITAQADAPGYAALAITVLLALVGAAAAAVLRGQAGTGVRGVPAWECGGEPPPPWLPFGDPLTEYGGRSFSQPLRQTLVRTAPAVSGGVRAGVSDALLAFAGRFRLSTTRQALAAIMLALVFALAFAALAEQL